MKIFKVRMFFLVFCLLFRMEGFTQQSILLNQSSYNLYVLSPAAIGLNTDITTNCHYKKNWLGIADSPEIMQLTIDGSLHKSKYALGLNLVNEKAGIFSKTYLSGAFRYRVKLNKAHHLLFGLSAGFQRQLSDFSKIKADAPDEFTQWPQQQAVTIPDASFGLAYTFKKLVITVSATQLLQQKYAYKEPVYNKELQYKTVSHFIISLQNTFTLKSETWYYTPSIILRTPQGLPVQYDFLNTLNYKNKLLMGIGYRHFYALYANLGFCITDKLRVIYSYEYSLGIQSYTRGGHEIGLTFGLSNKNSKPRNVEENLNKKALDEIFEKLDKHDQQIEVLTKTVDSLDKNLTALKSEMELLKSKQVNEGVVAESIENYYKKDENKNKLNEINNSASDGVQKNYIDKEGKYKVISPKNETEFESSFESPNSNYKIVLAVYQLAGYAKEYQRFLKRQFNWDSRLHQLNDHPKKYIYVCTIQEFKNLKDALVELRNVRRDVKSKNVSVTSGEAWILQTKTN